MAGNIIYSGAGNIFVMVDGRRFPAPDRAQVRALCEAECTDGLIVLYDAAGFDFRMDFFNPDGSGGMMCGNGGRCLMAFAADLGVIPERGRCRFLAPDGPHEAQILENENGVRQVRLRMKDVASVGEVEGGCFLDTGTRHFVTFVEDTDSTDVDGLGRMHRHREEFMPEGANANFVQVCGPSALKVRTFEKGVERETQACGTGITAAAIAAVATGRCESCDIGVEALGGRLRVDFRRDGDRFTDVFLTGPAERIR